MGLRLFFPVIVQGLFKHYTSIKICFYIDIKLNNTQISWNHKITVQFYSSFHHTIYLCHLWIIWKFFKYVQNYIIIYSYYSKLQIITQKKIKLKVSQVQNLCWNKFYKYLFFVADLWILHTIPIIFVQCIFISLKCTLE